MTITVPVDELLLKEAVTATGESNAEKLLELALKELLEKRRRRPIDAIHSHRVSRFVVQFDQLGCSRLHSERQFVGANARRKFIVIVSGSEMFAIHLLNQIESAPIAGSSQLRWWLQMQDWVRTRSHSDALIGCWQETASPSGWATFQTARRVRQNNKCGQVCIFTSKTIRDPTTHAWPSHQHAARVHLVDRLRMIDAIAIEAANDT